MPSLGFALVVLSTYGTNSFSGLIPVLKRYLLASSLQRF
ncbi:hypothetical protein AJ81_04435 [Pseudothermotoga hypogea DSM 11164 = NBRC 106472]|uniref:Uncharacterized protein n=1 Tax=Pseudothermotoga hypogea DSM 11164 = NBRC 106472 TaxID=1123384 RepID=A0A0X1KTY6_9THEM|nr:hypothetical protein AJ81_04435 [Pseudothermotoga hypogea DSM 11164 = NBRC 106472]